jgi:hypothetical protein
VNSASDTYLALVRQSPDVIDISLTHCDLMFILDEGVLLLESVLKFILLDAFLIQNTFLHFLGLF